MKWTSQNIIREIYVWLKDGKSIFITALSNFCQFEQQLASHIPDKTLITIKRERIDYDHPLFYVVLGVIVGLVGSICFTLLQAVNIHQIQIISLLLFGYSTILGLYFFITKPTAKRSGQNTVYLDYIAGATLVVLGIIMLLYMCL